MSLAKGKATVALTRLPTDGTPTGPHAGARIGIAPSLNPSFAAFLARALDDQGKAEVVPASQLAGAMLTTAPMASMMRSELRQFITTTCKRGKLDYLFLMDTGQPAPTAGFGASFGLGRMRWRSEQEAQLFDCRTERGVWHQTVMLETSRSVFNMGLSGSAAGLTGSPEADRAMAGVLAEKLSLDMGW